MKKLIILTTKISILLSSFLFLNTCDSTEPPPVKPPGYQEDIPWPSLADTPWPMERCDPQATGRSKYPGPRAGVIEWVIEDFEPTSAITIGIDSSVYCNSAKNNDWGFKAIKPNGDVKWNIYLGSNLDGLGTSVILKNDDILTTVGSTLKSISREGSLIKTYEAFPVLSALTIDKAGNMYALINELIAFNNNGEKLWSYLDYNFLYFARFSFSPDDKTLYIAGRGEPVFYAFDINSQTVKWTFGKIGGYAGVPIVDSEGNLYTICAYDLINPVENHAALYSLKENGEIRWKYDFGAKIINGWVAFYQPMAIDKLGNIYAGQDILTSIDYNGNLRWTKPFEENFVILSPITVDCEGCVYFVISDYTTSKLLAYSSEGNLIFSLPIQLYPPHIYSPVIGYDNSLYIASYEGNNLYKIK
ncbi:MAG: hypothetical protein V1720_01055 [bacterium]